MIDIDPPAHTPHTWRDFFIHMGTIVVGLVIAIGLEQTAEYIHHRHQAHQLEANMRAEAQANVNILNVHFKVNIPNLLWYRAALVAVRTAVPNNGFIDVTLPPEPNKVLETMIAPEHNVWPAAKAAGTVILLPDDLAQVYAIMDEQVDVDNFEVQRIRDVSAQVTRFELATGTRISPGRKLHLSLAQQGQLVTALAAEAQTLYDLLNRDNLFWETCQGVVQGIHDPGSIFRYILTQPEIMEHYR